uniref:SBF1/SBF2 domain-containing protein n=1 Tax=Globisporangium ultimum (strain ATCC 200006 / CBS 805.95 / DAOM BR144) TaxID=431595 RepID=K3WL70_GLOUD
MGDTWTGDDKAENHWRRTFCQIPFVDIYEHAEKGKRSLHGLVDFFRRKARAERTASEELRELLHAHMLQGGDAANSLEELEEPGTSIRKALMEVKSFVDATCNHQLLLAKVLEEQVAEPLESLQEASEMYIRILRDEIKNVNDEYTLTHNTHKQAGARLYRASEDLIEAKEKQRNALHGIGVPEFELQRLAARVAKCEDEKSQAEMVKAQAKNALYNRIIARDEMAMAVSVAYQKAEEERLDQLNSSLQRFLHVEQDRIKVAAKMLATLEQHIGNINRSEDIQLLIHNRRNPDNMHFQGKALALLDWHWGKMQSDHTPSKRRGYSFEHGAVVDDTSASASSNSMSALSVEPVVIPSSAPSRQGHRSSSRHQQRSPHGELAQTPMGLALRRYFANNPYNSPSSPVDEPLQRLELLEDGEKAPLEDASSSEHQTTELSDTAESSMAEPSKGSPRQDAVDGQEQADNSAVPSTTNTSSSPSALNLGVVKISCATQAGRALFVICLNRQRSLETKVKDQQSFDELVDCFNAFLDECIREDDIKAAKTAMILAETFYLPKAHKAISENGEIIAQTGDDDHHFLHHHHHGALDRGASRIYLQEEVKKHAIWKNPSFWEKALLLAIGEELQKTPQAVPWEDLPSGVPKHDGLPSREEAVGRVHNIVFGQLGSFTLSMLEFDVPLPQIESFVETMCDAHELTEDQRFLLRKNLQEIYVTLR